MIDCGGIFFLFLIGRMKFKKCKSFCVLLYFLFFFVIVLSSGIVYFFKIVSL